MICAVRRRQGILLLLVLWELSVKFDITVGILLGHLSGIGIRSIVCCGSPHVNLSKNVVSGLLKTLIPNITFKGKDINHMCLICSNDGDHDMKTLVFLPHSYLEEKHQMKIHC